MSRALWLARHGERQGEASPELADRPHDPPLTDRGRRQAELMGDRLRGCDVEAIYASPFLCAAETAHLVADRLDLSVAVDRGLSDALTPDLFEVAPSVLTPRVLAERFDTVETGHNSVVRPNYPETTDEARTRTRRTVGRLLGDAPDTVLFVGHAVTVESIAFGFTGVTVEEPPCGSLTRLTSYPWGWDMDRCAETAHLPGLGEDTETGTGTE